MTDQITVEQTRSILVADQLAAKIEAEFRAALDHAFGVDQWSEDMLDGKCCLKGIEDGSVLFVINDRPMLYIEKIEIDPMISHKAITVTFNQPVRRLY